jgi:hypothetical protein
MGQGNKRRGPNPQNNISITDLFTGMMNSSRTGVGTPQARDLGSSGNPVSPTGGVMGGLPTDYKSTEASAFASAARHRGEMADIRGGGGDTSSGRKPLPQQEVWKVPDSTLSNGRDDSRTNAKGVVQKGTDMSRSFNDLLATTNTSGYQPYSSNQLPTTQANPFSAQPPKTQSFDVAAHGVTGNSIADFGGDGSAAFAQSRETTANDTFNPDAARIEGGSSRKSRGSLSEALADTAGINSYMSKFSSGDQERAANRAFLDTEKSMEALRAKEAVNGVVYAQGQHFVSGKSGDDAAVAIDRSAARDISNGSETAAGASQKAQDFLQKKTADVTAAVKQSPTYLEDGAKDGAFQQDKPMFSGNTPAISGAVEFDNNNDQTLPTFGAPKGYKPQSTYKDTAFPNPFG